MHLHDLVRQLGELGVVETGHGPRHPVHPSDVHAAEIAAFLDRYPLVRRDPGYVDFLEAYAGLLLWREQDFLSLSIYGFDPDVSLHLTEGEGDTVTEDRFLTFADAAVPAELGTFSPGDPQGAAFGFDASGERPWGVYRCLGDTPYELFCPDFITWLSTLVEQRGAWL